MKFIKLNNGERTNLELVERYLMFEDDGEWLVRYILAQGDDYNYTTEIFSKEEHAKKRMETRDKLCLTPIIL